MLGRDARLLLAGVAVDAFGTGLTLPFLVVYLHEVRGLPLETVGAIVAVPATVALLLVGPVGLLVDTVGPRRVQMVALAGASAGALALAHATDLPTALLARVLMGLGWAAFWPANHALVASVIPSAARPHYFGVSFALLNAGIGTGGMVGALYVDVARPATFETVYVADALTFLVPLALLAGPLRHLGGPAARAGAGTAAAGSYGTVLRDPVFRRVLLLVFVATFVGYGQVEGGWTAYANEIARVSTRTLGLAFTVNTTVIVLSQLVVLRLVAGRRRTRVLVVLAVLWALSWATMGLAGLRPGTTAAALLFVASLGVFGVGETLLSPISPAIVNDVASDRLRGRYNAAAGFAFQLAAVAGPAVAGLVLGAGRGATFVTMLVVGCGVLALVALGLERRLSPQANGVAAPAPAAVDSAAGTA